MNITPTPVDQNGWQKQLDHFVENHHPQLAALAWGVHLEGESEQGTLGIDLKPTPHFVFCPKSAIELLNQNADNKLQEILGIIDGYKPEIEVLMICISPNRIKLIYFQPELAPPDCYARIATDKRSLMSELEKAMSELIQLPENM
ncbi:MAG: hypothetical protein P5702_04065 [Limnospira sp. PMC 1291.21]|uniref:Chaperone protein CcmS domain-containing protein n=3 Tax=Limnospira TaxID=2596745 RepID=A0A9P1KD47_9CYAN|nr:MULTISPECIES: hypothetical protein [Limnospira]EKD10631.1 hypothetical protein SPLC1_S060020 [Arthrospira platensis C1]MDC0838008.1 hypothetical protein [Limnoraphis robusta]MDY7053121.1 hypothetical protein [Limnospira fusiformis LS22]QJB28021.1 hypothetical protein HFV01_22400 [Limnospira fusiformis SAG 85.79]RAQ40388.1 hypothetical protein B9S53_16155 [Arthrospira sp. O9.13F]